MSDPAGNRPKTEKELKKEAEKAAKLAKFEEKQKKLAEKKAAASDKPVKEAKAKKEQTVEAAEPVDQTPTGQRKKIDGEIPAAYFPGYVESGWYSWWEKEGFFKPEYIDKLNPGSNPADSFTVCIPPPNVTGNLHVGHALATTVEDTITRFNRMHGKRTLFNPGCDHAGIATQVVVEKRLKRERGLTRHDLGRDRFNQEVWHWKNEKGDVIYDQFRKLGASVDWDRAVFTMDPKMCRAVTEAFIRMHESGTIYRSNRLVNWSCALRSAISDIEVDKKELTGSTLIAVPGYDKKIEFGVLNSFAYKIQGSDEEIVVSTTRIETMLGDSGVAVHPDDQRYKHLVGKQCIHPFIPTRNLPIFADSFVEMEFGTGAVKITPAHDHNDYEVGIRQNLPFHNCITDDGLISQGCGEFSGMKRFDARTAVIEALKEKGLYRGKEDNPMVVPTCSRSKDVIEPILKPQWYVKCAHMAEKAVAAVANGDLQIIPEFHKATWNRWLESSRDWCISRQLWWGHRIPAYYISFADGREQPLPEENYWVSARTEQEALAKAAQKFQVPEAEILLKWDEDVLDTWFSSGMWPFAVFGWPDATKDMDLFFPGAVLETGHDILFFWVARMVFMAQELTGKLPFKEILLHAMIRDAHGRKMSKSLGNVIDPLDVIRGISLNDLQAQLLGGNLDEKEIAVAKEGQARDYPDGIPECGVDALRFALLSYTSQGRDINLDVLRVHGYRKFCNKLWQVVRFALARISDKPEQKPTFEINLKSATPTDLWILSRLAKAVKETNEALKAYNFTQATTVTYNFWLYDFCDVYVETIKPVLYGDNTTLRQVAISVLHKCIDTGLRLISPLMPFISEELWQRMPRLDDSDYTSPSIIVAQYPLTQKYEKYQNEKLEAAFEFAQELIGKVRSLRADYDLKKTKITMQILSETPEDESMLNDISAVITTLTFSEKVSILNKCESDKIEKGSAHIACGGRCQVYINLTGIIDVPKEIEKLGAKLQKNQISVKKIGDIQSSADYEQKVPVDIRALDQEKKATLEKEIENITAAIAQLKALN
ncbi:Valine--tRNA ligase [Caenorhabditis elegans]|uniref:Valine--tRNA ligase n=1 Tax=Caenorhabditis elegans TaxID=6239 RepID=SYV_CAEEL|nr:Valine--tRNA ligase [Caenorhabditis elegans]Q9U1Q4.1 RecName: Full=Valine--tRNA ligase; AltName: Full=Valyl-tRNA synthetase; Short=ValRS [Caenorhabditis elegans]CAB60428.1 Valine--tRNA ligase [Caenorhabditis elegans]|eukprot:NP_493377.1 Valine--tRNA ligase [Caenorhabditis elegans]